MSCANHPALSAEPRRKWRSTSGHHPAPGRGGPYSLSSKPKPSHRASTASSLRLIRLSPRLRLRSLPTSHHRSQLRIRTYLRT
jgi:hypothetical protein